MFDRLLTPADRPALFLGLAFFAYAPTLAVGIAQLFHPLNSTLSATLHAFLPSAPLVVSAAAATIAIEGIRARRPPSFFGVLGSLRWLALLGTAILGGLLMVAGLHMLMLPMLIFGAWLALAGPAVQEEELTPWAGLNRRRMLVGEGRWVALLYIFLPLGIAKFLLDYVPQAGIRLVLGLSHEMTPLRLGLMLGWSSLIDILLLTMASTALAETYLETRTMETRAAWIERDRQAAEADEKATEYRIR
ncbi:MAG: hypothetical protein FJX76_15385 [Armatimonadetes bacterium]|nr:hypothetical protein [Armatimonadota bacterium]